MSGIEALQRFDWTSHNIELAPGVCTRPGQPLLRDEVRARAVFRELRRFGAGVAGFSGQRALDLGCLEGGFTVELARAGFDALGVEGRASNHAKCEALARHLALPNLRFDHRDVKSLAASTHGRFDAVLCLGLLYHLDDPMGFIEHLARDLTGPRAVMFLDTHVAPIDDAAMADFGGRDALSPQVQVEHRGHAYDGRWYHEYAAGGDAPDEAWTSVSNARSFWPSEPALIAALIRGGFERVFPIYGCFEIGEEFALRRQYSRAWYVATKD